MKITYLDHSGFVVTLDNAILVFDYYRDPSHGLHQELEKHPELPVVFFVSHSHRDHYNPDIFDLAQNHRRVFVMSNDVLPQNVPTTVEVQGMSRGDLVENLPGDISVKAYGSTDIGVSFLVTLKDGRKIFHAGDLNDWHWKDCSTPREVEEADNKFKVIVNRIASENPEMYLVMFPVDTRLGSDFARGARLFLEDVKVENFFPMHCFGHYKEACDFSSYAPATTKCYCLSQPGEHQTI